jgi:hypothetical protein
VNAPDREHIRALALECGFTLRPQAGGPDDLNEYVYEFAQRLLADQVPEGFAVLPVALTAENGAKAVLIGEFVDLHTIVCTHCDDGYVDGESCDVCGGLGEYDESWHVDWPTIKNIWSTAVSHFLASGGRS